MVEFLVSKAPMLKDYFSFEVDQEGRILTLPMLLHSHSPNLDRLPLFLVRLATEVSLESTPPPHIHWDGGTNMITTQKTKFLFHEFLTRNKNLIPKQAKKRGLLNSLLILVVLGIAPYN